MDSKFNTTPSLGAASPSPNQSLLFINPCAPTNPSSSAVLYINTNTAHRFASTSHIARDPLVRASLAILLAAALVASNADAQFAPLSLPPTLACTVSTCALTTNATSSHPSALARASRTRTPTYVAFAYAVFHVPRVVPLVDPRVRSTTTPSAPSTLARTLSTAFSRYANAATSACDPVGRAPSDSNARAVARALDSSNASIPPAPPLAGARRSSANATTHVTATTRIARASVHPLPSRAAVEGSSSTSFARVSAVASPPRARVTSPLLTFADDIVDRSSPDAHRASSRVSDDASRARARE
tara:strand:- start:53 stop:955 length:903 start_codon:yes stop_codon:yes gene_type:complete